MSGLGIASRLELSISKRPATTQQPWDAECRLPTASGRGGGSGRPGSCFPERGRRRPAARRVGQGRRLESFAPRTDRRRRGGDPHLDPPRRPPPIGRASPNLAGEGQPSTSGVAARPSTGLARSWLALAFEVPTGAQGRAPLGDLRDPTWVTLLTMEGQAEEWRRTDAEMGAFGGDIACQARLGDGRRQRATAANVTARGRGRVRHRRARGRQ